MEYKACSKCKNEYPATTEFFHKKGDKLASRCKNCSTKGTKKKKEDFQRLVEQFRKDNDEKVWNHCPFNIRVCTKCGEILVTNTSNFPRKSSCKIDGLNAQCKKCVAKRDKIYHDNNKEQRNLSSSRYYYEHREEQLEERKRYRKENPEKVKASQRKSYLKNRESILQQRKIYRENNLEDCKRRLKNWQKNNPDKVFNSYNKRRLKENSQGDGFTGSQWQEMMYYFDWTCAYSGEKLYPENRSVDHIVPIDKGGANEIWNLVPMIRNYNSSKRARDMLEWYKEQEFFNEERLKKIYEWQKYAYKKWGTN